MYFDRIKNGKKQTFIVSVTKQKCSHCFVIEGKLYHSSELFVYYKLVFSQDRLAKQK